jgi:hypothetical protein
MSPISISMLAFALMLLGIFAGGWVQGKLPEGHLSSDSKEVVKLSMGSAYSWQTPKARTPHVKTKSSNSPPM